MLGNASRNPFARSDFSRGLCHQYVPFLDRSGRAVMCNWLQPKASRDRNEISAPGFGARSVTTDPARFDRYTGTVASWKTDQLGFEVSGRVEFVVEPETNISGDVSAGEGGVSARGTELARLDPTRYELGVESAKAEIATAEKQREAAQIELDSVIPAQQEAAQAQFVLAKTEMERNEKSGCRQRGLRTRPGYRKIQTRRVRGQSEATGGHARSEAGRGGVDRRQDCGTPGVASTGGARSGGLSTLLVRAGAGCRRPRDRW